MYFRAKYRRMSHCNLVRNTKSQDNFKKVVLSRSHTKEQRCLVIEATCFHPVQKQILLYTQVSIGHIHKSILGVSTVILGTPFKIKPLTDSQTECQQRLAIKETQSPYTIVSHSTLQFQERDNMSSRYKVAYKISSIFLTVSSTENPYQLR